MTWDSTARASAAASPSERISATEVRRAVRSGQRLEDLVDPAVAAYIYGAGLYRANSCAHHRSETRSKIPARNESRPGPVRVPTVRRRASQGRPANNPPGGRR